MKLKLDIPFRFKFNSSNLMNNLFQRSRSENEHLKNAGKLRAVKMYLALV